MFFINKIDLCLKKLDGELNVDWEDIIDILGLTCSPHHLRKVAYGYKEYRDNVEFCNDSKIKILCISDIHIPYNLPEEFFKKYKNKVDILVINGDILDCQELSKFPKDYKINFIDEIVLAREYLINLVNIIKPKEVYVNDGNHDTRFGVYISRKIDSGVGSLLPTSPLKLILDDGFYNYDKMCGKQFFYKPLKKILKCKVHYENNYWCKIGDVIYCHPSAYSSAIMGTAKKAMEYFNSQGLNYKAIVLGHTHKLGLYKLGDKLLIEQGCVADTKKLKYFSGKLTLPQSGGYVYMELDNNNKLIKNSVKLVEI